MGLPGTWLHIGRWFFGEKGHVVCTQKRFPPWAYPAVDGAIGAVFLADWTLGHDMP